MCSLCATWLEVWDAIRDLEGGPTPAPPNNDAALED